MYYHKKAANHEIIQVSVKKVPNRKQKFHSQIPITRLSEKIIKIQNIIQCSANHFLILK